MEYCMEYCNLSTFDRICSKGKLLHMVMSRATNNPYYAQAPSWISNVMHLGKPSRPTGAKWTKLPRCNYATFYSGARCFKMSVPWFHPESFARRSMCETFLFNKQTAPIGMDSQMLVKDSIELTDVVSTSFYCLQTFNWTNKNIPWLVILFTTKLNTIFEYCLTLRKTVALCLYGFP